MTITNPRGGLRERLIIRSFRTMLHDSLEALNWFDSDRQHLPINWTDYPADRREQIPFNTIAVSFDDTDPSEMELGSNGAELVHTGYVDFYAEPSPPDGNGGEALGKHLIGDVLGILLGWFPEIGRDRPVLDVYDDEPTPQVLFTVQFDMNRTRTARANRYDQPWQRWWYSCVFELTDDFNGAIAGGYAGGYEGGY